MSPRFWILALLLATALGSPVDSRAAARLGPPSQELAGEKIVVVVAEIVELGEGTLILRAVEALSGELLEEGEASEEEVVVAVRASAAALASVEPPSRRIVGYTHFRRERLLREGYTLDPEGPRVVRVPIVGEALLPDLPELRTLIATPDPATEKAWRRLASAALDALGSKHPEARRFAAAELRWRQALHSRLRSGDLPTFSEAMQREDADPEVQSLLLETVEKMSGKAAETWIRDAAREVLAEHGSRYELVSGVPHLVRTAARLLGAVGEPGDVERLAPLLTANHPAVVKAALAGLDALSPEVAAAHARRALAAEGLHAQARQALERYLEGKGS